MPDYSKGKIYRIENDIDDEIYIGSTTQPLCKRWDGHKRHCKRGFSGKLYELIREYGVEHFKIVLVEEYPCDNVEQLTQKEAEYIRQIGTLNKFIPKKKDNGENKYKQGKIYKITNDIDDDVYIGSTTLSLYERWRQHIKNMKNEVMYPNSKLYTKLRKVGVEHFEIELIEEYSCDNKEELEKKEQEWIRTGGTLNSILPGRTKQEWLYENRAQILERKKQYYIANKDKLSEQYKKHYEENKEQILNRTKIYRELNKEIIIERKRQYYQANKEKLNSHLDCPCGSIYTITHKARHERSKKHIKWLVQQNS